MKQQTLLLVFGGESSEHDVSIMSARNIYSEIDNSQYKVALCFIDKKGIWHLLDNFEDYSKVSSASEVAFTPARSELVVIEMGTRVSFDILFPVLHGKFGEDGSIQGLAQMLHAKHVGCGIEASAVCMNKDTTKRLCEASGISVVPWITIFESDSTDDIQHKLESLRPAGPWFVKPSRSGSSVGVTKVTDSAHIVKAVRAAQLYDSIVLIEDAVNGRELEVAVMGSNTSPQCSGVGEIVPGNDFYDYDDKYSVDSKSLGSVDAEIEDDQKQKVLQIALDAYQVAGCSGLARVDFLLSQDGQLYLNEINTMPGFTNISMFPKLWEAAGINQKELVQQLIDSAI